MAKTRFLAGPRDADPPLGHIPARLTRRDREPLGQHPNRISGPHAGLGQHGSSGDPLSTLQIAHTTTSHAIIILPDMSLCPTDTPRPFQPPVVQRDLEAEVAHCVGGETTPPCGTPSPVGVNQPFSTTPACNHCRTSSLAGNRPICESK